MGVGCPPVDNENDVDDRLTIHLAMQNPPVDKEKDVDDLFTIRLAMQNMCQYVDNNLYRDWRYEPEKSGSEADLSEWLFGEGADLKVHFMFDACGNFIPSMPPMKRPVHEM